MTTRIESWRTTKRNPRTWPFTAVALIVLLHVVMTGQSPPQGDESRRIWDTSFRLKRPVGAATPAATPPVYKPGTAQPSAAGASPKTASVPDDAVIGVTILRLRPAAAADDKQVTLATKDAGGSTTEWTPIRVESGTPLAEGERVRLTIETPRAGHLYVIDRETYADGSVGDPYLIFPTLRTLGGRNDTTPGRLIEIPGSQDTPPYFTLRRSRPDQIGEILTLLVALQPLRDLQITRDPLKLTRQQVTRWEQQWGARVERIDMVGGAGKPYTKAEREAGTDRARLLTQEEPLPQTIYRVAARKGDPLLVTVPLRIGK